MFGDRGMNNQQFPATDQIYNAEDVHRSEFYKNVGMIPGVLNKTFNGRPAHNLEEFEIKTELDDKLNWNNQHNYTSNENLLNADMNGTSSQMNQNQLQNSPLDIYNNSLFYQNNFQSVFPLDFYGRHHQALANTFLSAYSNVNNPNLVVQQYLQQCNSQQVINNFNTLKESNSNNNPHYANVKKVEIPTINNSLPPYQQISTKPMVDVSVNLLHANNHLMTEEKPLKMYNSCDVNKQKCISPPYDSLKQNMIHHSSAYNNGDLLNNVFMDKGTPCDLFKREVTRENVKIVNNSDDLCNGEIDKDKKPFRCWKCNFNFSSEDKLKIHNKYCGSGNISDQNATEQSNAGCISIISDQNLMEQQVACQENGTMKIETESKGRYSCELCPYVCQSPAILKIHERVHSGEKPFACTFCDYKSGQKNNVAKHMLVHMKEKPYKCQYCDYRCAQKNNLIVHERTHTGVKPFACTFCEYKTVQKPNLVKHMYLHTNEKPFACDICDYRCVQKTNLTKHKQKHTMEKPFVCNICDYKSSQKSNLTKHIMTHIKEKPLKCDQCQYRCAQKVDMDKHMQSKHNLTKVEEEDEDSTDIVAKVSVYNTRSNSAQFNPVNIDCVKIENASANF